MKKKLDQKIKLGSHQVLAALREKMFAGDAWAWLTEVRNGTGYARAARSADALAVSCWPSRGLFASGIEVKVSRSDWKRELLEPAKSDEVQRFCKHWWIATSPGIVLPEELPPTWGLVETDGKTCSVVKVAPELEPKEPTWLFVASVLRNGAKNSEEALRRARSEGFVEGNRRADETRMEFEKLATEIRQLAQLKSEVASLRASAEEFQNATNLPLHGWRATDRIAKVIRLANAIDKIDPDMLARTLASNAEQMRMVGELVSQFAKELTHGA